MTIETFLLLSGTLSLVAVIPLACLIAVVCMLRAERRRADTIASVVREVTLRVRSEAAHLRRGDPEEWPARVGKIRDLATRLYRIADGEGVS